MRLHYLQHIELENPGSILNWAQEKGHAVTHTRFYEGEVLPRQEEFDWLIIMGGPMNIYEEHAYPWLAEEKAFIRQAIDGGKPVVGICLGSQLIADVIGGKVTANEHPEIGWHPVRWSEEALRHPLFSGFPREAVVFHWHYDTFTQLPPDALVLAGSEGCSRQAFIYRERVVGLQFHLENTPELLQGYVALSGDEMKPARYVQSPEEVLAHPEYIVMCNAWMKDFLDKMEKYNF